MAKRLSLSFRCFSPRLNVLIWSKPIGFPQKSNGLFFRVTLLHVQSPYQTGSTSSCSLMNAYAAHHQKHPHTGRIERNELIAVFVYYPRRSYG